MVDKRCGAANPSFLEDDSGRFGKLKRISAFGMREISTLGNVSHAAFYPPAIWFMHFSSSNGHSLRCA
jgi:hypothetical protein